MQLSKSKSVADCAATAVAGGGTSSGSGAGGEDGQLTCPICICCMDDDIRLLPCGHSFCSDCVDHILKDAHGGPMCPMDRRPFKKTQVPESP